jgi:hypothetical protein
MHSEKEMLRVIAKGYAVLVGALLLWAWCIEVLLRNSSREHLAPAVFLAIESIPSSLSLDFFYRNWTELFARPYVQLAWISFCAIAQVGLVFLLAHMANKWSRNA